MVLTQKTILSKIYYDPAHPASYAGVDRLYKAVKSKGITKKHVKKWLQSQQTYTITRPARRRFKRHHIYVTSRFERWDTDLMDVSDTAHANDKTRFILVCIDLFSRFLWVEPLKNKQGKTVAEALSRILSHTKSPLVIRHDAGLEYLNKNVTDVFKKYKIYNYSVTDGPKASYAERCIRTLRLKIARYLLQNNSHRYIDELDKLVLSYNKAKHNSTGWAPVSVTDANTAQVMVDSYALFYKRRRRNVSTKYKAGQLVRISHLGSRFAKESHYLWSTEVFRINKIVQRTDGPVYELIDLKNNIIGGKFYDYEIQHVDENVDTVYRIDKVLRRRTFRGRRQALVSWWGYNEDHNSWIDEKQLFKYT